MKTCPACQKYLPASSFYARSNAPGRFHTKCIPCFKSAEHKRYREKRQEILEYKRVWSEGNKDKIREKHRKFRELNPDYAKRRYREDEAFRLRAILRARVVTALKRRGYAKSSSLRKILGCDYESLREYIESMFQPGMSWGNHGEWHLDHRIPLASGKDMEEIVKLCHYTNLQPMWAAENLRKGAKLSP